VTPTHRFLRASEAGRRPGWAAVPLLVAWLTVAWLTPGCGTAPDQSLTWRESWEVLVLGNEGDLVDARITVGNTGLLRGQAHLRTERWAPDEAPIIYARDIAPVEVNQDADGTVVHLGYDGLAQGEDSTAPQDWTLRARDDAARVLLHVEPYGIDPSAIPPVGTEADGWKQSAPVPLGRITGWVSAAGRGGLVEGYGALLRRGGSRARTPPRQTILVASQTVSICVDRQGDQTLSWMWLDGALQDPGDAALSLRGFDVSAVMARPAPGHPSTIAFSNGVTVELHLSQKVRGRRLHYEHLLPAEQRLLSWLNLWTERRVRRGWARITANGGDQIAPAVVVEVGPASWTGPVQRPVMDVVVDSAPIAPAEVPPGAPLPDPL